MGFQESNQAYVDGRRHPNLGILYTGVNVARVSFRSLN
jgi:hypothetical protein